MGEENKLRILIAGYGTIGRFLTRLLIEERSRILRHHGVDLELSGVLRRTERSRESLPFGIPLFVQAESAIAQIKPDLVVEVTGAVQEILPLYELAFKSGADVVTANKAVLAYYGRYLRELSNATGRVLLAEASVGGIIPILRTLHTSLAGDRIRKILGVWNGTCNYILTRMESEGRFFDEILEDAKKKGYAEPDPRLDIEGNDTAYKALVLAQVAFALDLHPDQLEFRGISEIVPEDFSVVKDLGFRPKMVGWLEKLPQGVQIYVGPALLPRDHPVAVLEGVTNGIYVEGEIGRGVFLSGRGAGPGPTAIAILGDILEVARMRSHNKGVSYWGDRAQRLDAKALIPYRELSLPCYLRFHVLDRPGTLARIAGVLGDLGISIESMIQPIRHEVNAVPIHLTTHSAPLHLIETALSRIYPPLLSAHRHSQLHLDLTPLSPPEEISSRPPFWMPILS